VATNVLTDVTAKAGKTDGKSASDQADAGDKQTKKDAAAVTTVAPVLIAAASPQQPAQVSGPADQPTTNKADAANAIQPAQTVSAAAAANAAVASADPADQDVLTPQGEPTTNPNAPAKTADQNSAAPTATQTKASEAGVPVASAVAAAKAAPESAVVLPKVTRPFGKADREEAPADSTKATALTTGDAGESSGIAAPDPNAPPAAAANARSAATPGQTSPREQPPQAHRAASDASSNAPTDKTGTPGDPGLAAPTGAGTGVAVSSTAHAAATQSTNTSATAAPSTPTAPVPLAGIPLAIAGRAQAGERHFDIRLDPPELGRIEVRMKVDRDGRITSHLIADRHDTLDLLRRDGAGLERALQDAGLKTAGEGLQFSLRDNSSNAGQDGRQNSNNLTHLVVQDDVAPVRESLPLSYGRLAGRIGGLDIRV
jgi:flagellar hook-length control protein FliK